MNRRLEPTTPTSLFDHYRRLWLYARHRSEGDNYQAMRAYFARVLITEVEQFRSLRGASVLDVGGAGGEFCRELHALRACDATNLDPFPNSIVWPRTVVGSADAIPFPNDSFDVVLCRGVFEHLPPTIRLSSVREAYRVLKPGGLYYVVIPPWFTIHAGHNLKPFHWLPFPAAQWLRRKVFGNTVKGRSLAEAGHFPITYRVMAALLRRVPFRLLATRDTHFRLHILTRVPILRECAVPAVAFILEKPVTVATTVPAATRPHTFQSRAGAAARMVG